MSGRRTARTGLVTGIGALGLIAGLLGAPDAQAAGGAWVPGFNAGAPVVQPLSGYNDVPAVTMVGPSTFVAYDSYPPTAGTTIERFTAAGALDTAWSGDGVLTLPGVPQVMTLRGGGQGRLLVGGLDASGDALVGRLLPNGRWDKTFSGDGKAVLPVDSFFGVRALAVDGSGRVLAALSAQRTNIQLKTDFLVARLTSGGRVDRTFGVGGYATVDTSRIDSVRALALDGAQQVYVMGATDSDPNVTGYRALVVRLTKAGRLDTTYGKGGRVFPRYGSGTGQVVVYGHVARGRLTLALASDANELAGIRLLGSGRLDTTYGTSGGGTGWACSCSLQSATWAGNGLVMNATTGDPTKVFLAKLDTAGQPASSWGVAGTSSTDLPAGVFVDTAAIATAPKGGVALASVATQDDGVGGFTYALVVGRLTG